MTRRSFLRASAAAVPAAAVASTLAATPALAAKPEIYTSLLSSKALGGYDAVAYFTVGKPVKGSSSYSTEYKGATWLFSSQEHLDKFKANPTAYAPQYGGYCAYGVSQNATVKGDPLLWKIVDNKLYLNINEQVVDIWTKDIPGYIVKANTNWPKVLD